MAQLRIDLPLLLYQFTPLVKYIETYFCQIENYFIILRITLLVIAFLENLGTYHKYTENTQQVDFLVLLPNVSEN